MHGDFADLDHAPQVDQRFLVDPSLENPEKAPGARSSVVGRSAETQKIGGPSTLSEKNVYFCDLGPSMARCYMKIEAHHMGFSFENSNRVGRQTGTDATPLSDPLPGIKTPSTSARRSRGKRSKA